MFDLELTVNIVFVAAACEWHQCWEITHNNVGRGWRGSEVCANKCPNGRWRDRSILHLDMWGCRLDVDNDVAYAKEFEACCSAQGEGYKYLAQDC